MPDVVAFFARERTQQDMESVITDVVGKEGVTCAQLISPLQGLREFRQEAPELAADVSEEDLVWTLKVALHPGIAYSDRGAYARQVIEVMKMHNSLPRIGVGVDSLPESKWRAPSCT
jgi:hypothetical protein